MGSQEKYNRDYQELSGIASDVARQLSFAGIALVWVFRSGSEESVSVPDALVLPALLFALSLAFDLLQYIVSAATWGIISRHMERNRIEEKKQPPWVNWFSISSWCLKMVLVVSGYWFVVNYLVRLVSVGS